MRNATCSSLSKFLNILPAPQKSLLPLRNGGESSCRVPKLVSVVAGRGPILRSVSASSFLLTDPSRESDDNCCQDVCLSVLNTRWFTDFGWTAFVPLVTLRRRTASNPGVTIVKQPNSLLRVTVVVSSVLLAATFISYRAGAFDGLLETIELTAVAGSTPIRENRQSNGSQSRKISAEANLFQQRPPAGAKPAPTIMAGPKSFVPSIFRSGLIQAGTLTPDLGIPILPVPVPPAQSPEAPPVTAKRRRTIMPGPKSGWVLDPPLPLNEEGPSFPPPSQPSKRAP